VPTQPNLVAPSPGADERRFAGFPRGRLAFTSVPDLFFSELLPEIDGLVELKVTLHVIWLLQRRKGEQRWVCGSELAHDALLLRGLSAQGDEPAALLRQGLEQAVGRGTLIRVRADGNAEWYLVNSAAGRETLAALRRGDLLLPTGGALIEERPLPAKKTIFALYEQNVGPLQPIIAEELEEAECAYPEEWIEEAFRIAAENNARSWRYVRAILERWQRQGRDSAGLDDRRRSKRYISGEYEEYRQR